jgi:predicted aspartyl protease
MERKCLFLLIMLAILGAYACNNYKIVDDAIKKHGAAVYFYNQGDYSNARLTCQEAIELWIEIKQSKKISFPDWSADNHIETCKEILEDLPVSDNSGNMTVVPIKVRRHRIFVKAVLNDAKSVNLLLDTGATTSLLTPEIAAVVGIEPAADAKKRTVYLLGDKQVEMPFVKLPVIRVGDATVKNLSVGIYSVEPDQPSIDGILGEDFLSHYIVSVDHVSKRLKLIYKE